MSSKATSIPIQKDHLELIEKIGRATQTDTTSSISKNGTSADLVGTALSALYQASTCARKCRGGDHILEFLSGRAYNLGCSAYILITNGFYDEAQNLIRSIGEIQNIVTLSAVDRAAFEDWLTIDSKKRRRKYGPAKVRRILEGKAPTFLYIDTDRYSTFCEKYTHVGPATRPNLYDDLGRPVVGGLYQSDGLNKSMNELAKILGILGLMVCKYFEFDDLFQQLKEDGSESGLRI